MDVARFGIGRSSSVWCEQGHNFGLKSGVPTQKENEAPLDKGRLILLLSWDLGPKMRKGENVEEASPSHPGSQSVIWALSVGSTDRKPFYCNLISTDCLCWQQILQVFMPRSGVHRYSTVPQYKQWGYGTDTGTPHNCRKLHLLMLEIAQLLFSASH